MSINQPAGQVVQEEEPSGLVVPEGHAVQPVPCTGSVCDGGPGGERPSDNRT